MLRKGLLLVTALAVFAVPSCAQTPQAKPVRIEQLMNAASRRKTGVEQLVPLERKLLNDWLTSHRSVLVKAAFGEHAPSGYEALYPIRLEVLMTPEELRQTGIERLRPKQRKALNEWLSGDVGLFPEPGSMEAEVSLGYAREQQERQKKAEDIKASESARLEAEQKYHVTPVNITSIPTGAEIEVDGKFVGNTPAELPLAPGQRTIKLSKKGYRAYQRTIEVLSGGTQRIAVDLEKE